MKTTCFPARVFLASHNCLNMRTEPFNVTKKLTFLNGVKWLSQHLDIFFVPLKQTVLTQIIAAD